ncbi:hypothetical protein M427DRAFT_131811 [Gonapodya prolifera JEL478]|uniref:Uncharacterized protein n=1 Tax=Gonapodya prolifera (strain JEL478) TaxID=1344416 RepID=A0A139ASZ7_GONPJ|nr:hypothetical protein M427DRAFT_131811 [Gonapodya prolifera JEL478]|eukprot:KXS19856.1 hypothetical protein M427DRAFT_131811 [Gonapodya prolifera JEL478]
MLPMWTPAGGDPAALLVEAAESGDSSLVRALLEAGADPNSRKTVTVKWRTPGKGSISSQDDTAECESVLGIALRERRLEVLDVLLATDGTDINAPISWRVPNSVSLPSVSGTRAENLWRESPNWYFPSSLDLALTLWSESAPASQKAWNLPGGSVIADPSAPSTGETWVARNLEPNNEVVKRLLLHGARVTSTSLERAQELAIGRDGMGLPCAPQPEFLALLEAQNELDGAIPDDSFTALPPIIPVPIPLLSAGLGKDDVSWVEDPIGAFGTLSRGPKAGATSSFSDEGNSTVVLSTARGVDSEQLSSVMASTAYIPSLPRERRSSSPIEGALLDTATPLNPAESLKISNKILLDQLSVTFRELREVREKVRALGGNSPLSTGSGSTTASTEPPIITALRRHHSLLSRQHSRMGRLVSGYRDYISGSCNLVHAGHAHTRREADEMDIHRGDALGLEKRWGDGWATGINYTTSSRGTFPIGCITERAPAHPQRYRHFVPPRSRSHSLPPQKAPSETAPPVSSRYSVHETPGTWTASNSTSVLGTPGTWGTATTGLTQSGPRRVVRYALGGDNSSSGRASASEAGAGVRAA